MFKLKNIKLKPNFKIALIKHLNLNISYLIAARINDKLRNIDDSVVIIAYSLIKNVEMRVINEKV